MWSDYVVHGSLFLQQNYACLYLSMGTLQSMRVCSYEPCLYDLNIVIFCSFLIYVLDIKCGDLMVLSNSKLQVDS